ncbi:uncharacterized protein LOC107785817 [Nicotiana tabacum]|uniref:Retrotransposon Copia-like N-terminal domain-containing protein n=2 Tax=Nicotiana tabacum TaxID=4097 RepID=A0A1S3ZEG7_TOBAC|nr:PREDICTED: uncharacterized protein LOC107785817 [Nicotiana tabacum]XP_016462683.1 PREDICTED: uncharacterized protein LOC107785817 [Nicotiana tabacum]
MAKTDLDHNHILYLHPSNTTRAPIVSIQLTGTENYSVWSRAMRIQLLGKNKLGLIDGTLKIEDFEEDLGHQWDRCNAIVLGWIMSSVSKELLTGIVYAKDAYHIWEDLRERFDKVNASRVYQLHKEIATLYQGTNSVSVYFTKLKELWDEYESMTPPSCDCRRSKDFNKHLHRQKLMQFLMGLNENYEQARSQILMTNPTPSVSKAYSMIIERESQRSFSNVSMVGEGSEATAFLSTKGGSYPKPKKNWNIQCEFCKMKGHSKKNCYNIVGYPADFKFRKKGQGNSTAYNANVGNYAPNVPGPNAGRNDDGDTAALNEIPRPPVFTTDQYN